jgi:two-component system, NarL family, nitrate/nitrite response regulator NarL
MRASPRADPKRLRVIVADPRNFMRGCLACWLSKFDAGLELIMTADAVQAVKGHAAPPSSVVILSTSSRPEGRAWLNEQAAGLLLAVPNLPSIVLTDETDTAAGQDIALSLGACGFIPMSSSPEIAFAALSLVVAGGRYFPYVANTGAWRPIPISARSARCSLGTLDLTAREQDVFELLAGGMPNKLIAHELGMALSTVKVHVHHILKKLHLRNRTEVAIRGKNGSLPPTLMTPEQPVSQSIIVHEMR